jgi:hypothetical protein
MAPTEGEHERAAPVACSMGAWAPMAPAEGHLDPVVAEVVVRWRHLDLVVAEVAACGVTTGAVAECRISSGWTQGDNRAQDLRRVTHGGGGAQYLRAWICGESPR